MRTILFLSLSISLIFVTQSCAQNWGRGIKGEGPIVEKNLRLDDFSGLKLKVIGAIVAISAIDLLKTFMNLPEQLSTEDSNAVMWKVLIHMAFVLSGVLFAVMDKIAGDTQKH